MNGPAFASPVYDNLVNHHGRDGFLRLPLRALLSHS